VDEKFTGIAIPKERDQQQTGRFGSLEQVLVHVGRCGDEIGPGHKYREAKASPD
jgi:hypothetical protein